MDMVDLPHATARGQIENPRASAVGGRRRPSAATEWPARSRFREISRCSKHADGARDVIQRTALGVGSPARLVAGAFAVFVGSCVRQPAPSSSAAPANAPAALDPSAPITVTPTTLDRQHALDALAAPTRRTDGHGVAARRLHEHRRLDVRPGDPLGRARRHRRRVDVARHSDRSRGQAQRPATPRPRAAARELGSRAGTRPPRGRLVRALHARRRRSDGLSVGDGHRRDRPRFRRVRRRARDRPGGARRRHSHQLRAGGRRQQQSGEPGDQHAVVWRRSASRRAAVGAVRSRHSGRRRARDRKTFSGTRRHRRRLARRIANRDGESRAARLGRAGAVPRGDRRRRVARHDRSRRVARGSRATARRRPRSRRASSPDCCATRSAFAASRSPMR